MKISIDSAFEKVSVDKDTHYTFEMTKGRIIPFQRLSEVVVISLC